MEKASLGADFRASLEDMRHENARVVSIVIGALVDTQLQAAILTSMRKLNGEISRKLFDGYGPLATCAAKIDVGFALGLYESGARKDLITLNRIRNRFAHELGIQTFEHPEITELCGNLVTPEHFAVLTLSSPAKTARTQFTVTASHLLGGLGLIASRGGTAPKRLDSLAY